MSATNAASMGNFAEWRTELPMSQRLSFNNSGTPL
jgi:hypothetical protein